MSPAAEAEPIGLFDLASQNEPLHTELLAAIDALARQQRFIMGDAVTRFERVFAAEQGGGQAVALSSGTDALLVALMALGIGPGDEVITTPFTFVATAEAIRRVGAEVVFADIDPRTFLLDVDAARARIGPRTRALLPVHLFGRACPMDAWSRAAADASVALMEDCAQAQGARFHGTPVGRFGSLGAFSFFPTKNLGGWGDGGLLLCADEDLAAAARALRDHGASQRGRYERVGGNFRLDGLQAAVLERKLPHVPTWTARRVAAAERYATLFAQAGLLDDPDPPLRLPEPGGPAEHTFGLYVVRAHDREALLAHLRAARIDTGVYYDRPLHLQACFSDLGHRPGDFPQAERAAKEVLALPCHAAIRPGQQQRVVDCVRAFYRGAGA